MIPPVGRPRIELRACGSERAFADKVLGCLEPWFKIDREVTGTHPFGQRLRIDAVLQPLDDADWHDPNPAFGVEFKQAPQHTRDSMRLAAQALDYTYVDWVSYGRLGVFMCTPGPGAFPIEGTESRYLVRLLGQFCVGELGYFARRNETDNGGGWALRIHGDHTLWSQDIGAYEAKRRTIRPKVGSR